MIPLINLIQRSCFSSLRYPQCFTQTNKTAQNGQHSVRLTVTGHYCLQSVYVLNEIRSHFLTFQCRFDSLQLPFLLRNPFQFRFIAKSIVTIPVELTMRWYIGKNASGSSVFMVILSDSRRNPSLVADSTAIFSLTTIQFYPLCCIHKKITP